MGEKEIENTPDFPGCFCFSAGVFRGLPRSCSPQARFRQSIQAVCQGDYTAAQLLAWAGRAETITAKRLLACDTLVAEEKGCLLGFANLEPGGYLDCLYTAAESQRRGVAAAWRQGEKLLRVEASRTARFFLSIGGSGYRQPSWCRWTARIWKTSGCKKFWNRLFHRKQRNKEL